MTFWKLIFNIPFLQIYKCYTRSYYINKKEGELSGVGFEPTPTRVDCDLNAAP